MNLEKKNVIKKKKRDKNRLEVYLRCLVYVSQETFGPRKYKLPQAQRHKVLIYVAELLMKENKLV